jgi:hypothetical protein
VFAHHRKRGYISLGARAPVYVRAVAKILKKTNMKKLKIIRLKIQLFLLHTTTHPHIAQWVQLLWAAVEKLIIKN